VNRLKDMKLWPLRSDKGDKVKWEVRLYSGQYNIKGMSQGDVEALGEIMTMQEGQEPMNEPIVDMAKYVCFGGGLSHSWTSNFTTFAKPNLASKLNVHAPLLAAALKKFTERFNSKLIGPRVGLFGCKKSYDEVLNEEEIQRFNSISEMHDVDKPAKTQEYARELVADKGLFDKVANFKKSTLFAFSKGYDDSPLCDQLLFLYEWQQQFSADPNNRVFSMEVGEWKVDPEKGRTQVTKMDQVPMEKVRGFQPVMEDPFDEDSLEKMQNMLQEYLLGHLEWLYPCETPPALPAHPTRRGSAM